MTSTNLPYSKINVIMSGTPLKRTPLGPNLYSEVSLIQGLVINHAHQDHGGLWWSNNTHGDY